MKKIILLILCITTSLLLFSCNPDNDKNNNDKKSAIEVAESVLDESTLSKEEYSPSKLSEFELRFTKIGLEKGFTKVFHYRSTAEYVYLIEFESPEDAEKFHNTVGAGSKYDITYYENVVAYGDSDLINGIFE